mmetsp:Transcript_28418/g.45111  ORF Transcript_28418/g.45111 Transcript_28418/m.45111 type:complete len:703 (-) Transcript_28418:137-2245(-)
MRVITLLCILWTSARARRVQSPTVQIQSDSTLIHEDAEPASQSFVEVGSGFAPGVANSHASLFGSRIAHVPLQPVADLLEANMPQSIHLARHARPTTSALTADVDRHAEQIDTRFEHTHDFHKGDEDGQKQERYELERLLKKICWGFSIGGFVVSAFLFPLIDWHLAKRKRAAAKEVIAGPHSRTALPVMSAAAAQDDGQPKGIMQKIKNVFPPKKELKKMLPLSFMFFCILFTYTVLRDTKDVLVVTSGGAEVIPFLKTYLNLPAAIGVTVIYSSMLNYMPASRVFYVFVWFFTFFFGSFATLIYPNVGRLHPIGFATGLAESMPSAFGPLISIFKFWTFGLFYTCAELWGSVVSSLLFWSFANSVCSVHEATRWYPLFGMLANVALIFSGLFVRRVSALRSALPPGVDAWGYSLKILMTAVVIGACTLMLTYRWMQRNVLTDPECVPPDMEKKKKKTKTRMKLGESVKYLASSSYIRNLAFLVIAYGTSMNIVEVTWKGKLKQAFPNPNDYSSFMGAFSSCTGVVTLTMMFVSRFIFSRFGWGVAALVTPTMIGLTGATFFSLILFPHVFAPLTGILGVSPLMLAVLVGAAQNIFSKACKYSLFDPCKETAYIPLDEEMRTKGKAAIDVIGNPLGKSGGAFIQQLAIVVFGSLAASTPALGLVLASMIGLWIKASSDLAVQFEEKTSEDKEDEVAAETAS